MGKCTLSKVMYHSGCALVVHDILECTFPHIPHKAIVHLYNIQHTSWHLGHKLPDNPQKWCQVMNNCKRLRTDKYKKCISEHLLASDILEHPPNPIPQLLSSSGLAMIISPIFFYWGWQHSSSAETGQMHFHAWFLSFKLNDFFFHLASQLSLKYIFEYLDKHFAAFIFLSLLSYSLQ